MAQRLDTKYLIHSKRCMKTVVECRKVITCKRSSIGDSKPLKSGLQGNILRLLKVFKFRGGCPLGRGPRIEKCL